MTVQIVTYSNDEVPLLDSFEPLLTDPSTVATVRPDLQALTLPDAIAELPQADVSELPLEYLQPAGVSPVQELTD